MTVGGLPKPAIVAKLALRRRSAQKRAAGWYRARDAGLGSIGAYKRGVAPRLAREVSRAARRELQTPGRRRRAGNGNRAAVGRA
ncbi:hypothetical protein BSIN_0567 [Burkholderia singularis]|uniref:Uncharacterized protein n=1 Tax=Burkholderia singularis TaxID=1503053 RepID=A0A238H7D8_9BURK|nr:hypothetical protein BSIN_0567 [Burkholderia singularis]